jgi:hypothetical protein
VNTWALRDTRRMKTARPSLALREYRVGRIIGSKSLFEAYPGFPVAASASPRTICAKQSLYLADKL